MEASQNNVEKGRMLNTYFPYSDFQLQYCFHKGNLMAHASLEKNFPL